MMDRLSRIGGRAGWATAAWAWVVLAAPACEDAKTPAAASADTSSADMALGDTANADAAALDGSSDTAKDAAAETAADVAPDTVTDTVTDSVADAVVDAVVDAAADVAKDVVADAGADAATDATADAPVDAGTEAGPSDAGAADAKDVAGDTGLCSPPQPPGTICQGSVWMCAPGYFHGFGKTECFEATCANMAKVLKESIDAAVAKSHSCTGAEDGECIVVSTSTACQGTCGMAVNGGMANDVALVVGWVDDHICKEFGYAAKCGFSTPKCMAPKPFCSGGACAYAP